MELRPVYRVTTYIPAEQLEALLEGVRNAVPMPSGHYDSLAWWSEAVEQFRALPGAQPTRGEIGTIARVATLRVEFSIPRDPVLLQAFLNQGLLPNHPWEQPTIFVDESMAPA